MKINIVTFLIIISIPALSQEIKVIKYPELASIIADTKEQIKVINFWATWCGPCVKELHQFEALKNKYNKQGIEVILVSFDFIEQLDNKVKPFITKKGLTTKMYLLDEMDYNSFIDKVDSRWSGAIPATLMINNRTGKRVFCEKEFLENELEKAYLEFVH